MTSLTTSSSDDARDETLSQLRPTIRSWLIAIVCVALFLPVSFLFLDRPLATLSFQNLHAWQLVFRKLTYVAEWLPGAAVIVIVWAVILVARGRTVGPLLETLTRAAAGLCVAIVAKDQLKVLFGRTWPETWVANNPSFIGNGTYGFFPMHGGQGWASFPSGHMAVICSVAAALWVLWPKGRAVYALAVLTVAVGLLGADYHWLSDMVAGGALGAAVGIAAARVGRHA